MNLQPDILPQYRQVSNANALSQDTDIKQKHLSPVVRIDIILPKPFSPRNKGLSAASAA